MKLLHNSGIKRSDIIAYSSLAVPLAFVELPLFIHLPKFYSQFTVLSLSQIGMILFFVRFFDAIKDPIVGYYADSMLARGVSRSKFIAFFIAILIIGFWCLWNPMGNPALWFVMSLLVVQLADGSMIISYYAMGSEITSDYHERTRITSMREGFRIFGLLLAGVVPSLLAMRFGVRESYDIFAIIFAVTLIAGFVWFAKKTPKSSCARMQRYSIKEFKLCFENRDFMWIMLLHMLNVFAFAVPTALLAFFIEDVLGGKAYEGLFFAIYFVSGILGMGIWLRLARIYGKKGSWICSQLVGILALFMALWSTHEGFVFFGVVFAFAGLSFGADLALPPSILADAIDNHKDPYSRSAASYFSIWNITGKLSTAMAPGMVFPLLSYLGYNPGNMHGEGAQYLILVFAMLPVITKLFVVAFLLISPIDGWKISNFLKIRDKII